MIFWSSKQYHSIIFPKKCRVLISKATQRKARLTALHVICLHIFRHFAHKFLDIRQYAFKISVQSNEKSDCASAAQSLCGVALSFCRNGMKNIMKKVLIICLCQIILLCISCSNIEESSEKTHL